MANGAGVKPPRLDPLGIIEMLEPMNSRQIGEFAYPFVRACLLGTEDNGSRHILDMVGWALQQREQNVS